MTHPGLLPLEQRPGSGVQEDGSTPRYQASSASRDDSVASNIITHTPKTEDEIAALLRERPGGWEWMLYVGRLRVARDSLREQYRDHLLRYGKLTGPSLGEDEAIALLRAAFPDVLGHVDGLMRMFDADAHERAFGVPGESGDPELIEHLAVRTIEGYAQLMEWASGLRSARVPNEFRDAVNIAADMALRPVEEVRDYIESFAEVLDTTLAGSTSVSPGDPPTEITVELVLTVDEDLTAAFNAEVARLVEAGY